MPNSKLPPGRASNEASKLDIIMRLGKLWLAHPNLRLGQLIWNALNSSEFKKNHSDPDTDFFHFEDNKFIEALEDHYK